MAELVEPTGELHEVAFDGEIQVRSLTKREVDLRLLAWDTVRTGKAGPEKFMPGAFEGIDPTHVVLQLEHQDPPAGKGIELHERADGPYMTFKVSKTQRGDDILALAEDGVTRGASVSYYDVDGGTEIAYDRGRRTRVVRKADLRAVSTTWRPTWEQSAVLNVRSREEGEGPMAEPIVKPAKEADPQPEATPTIVVPHIDFEPLTSMFAEQFEKFSDRMHALEERSRSDFRIPGAPADKKATLYEWASVAVRVLKGGRIGAKELQERTLDDVFVTDNPGLVPDAFLNDLVGLIDNSRPFLSTTTKIVAPSTGMSLVVPVIAQHSTADVQSTEKTDIESTALQVTTASFDAVTIAGGADISIQMLKRADPSFFDLLIRDLTAAYAGSADSEAIDALMAATPSTGTGALDPEDLNIGEAWSNSMAATGNAPDTIWLSSAAVASFIDAKSDGSNRPLYFNLNANFGVGTGTGGNVSALRPVYCRSLDHTGTDVLVGPSTGFAWAEEGTFTLQADVPSKAGRDIAIVGILFFVPRYPSAFTTYALA